MTYREPAYPLVAPVDPLVALRKDLRKALVRRVYRVALGACLISVVLHLGLRHRLTFAYVVGCVGGNVFFATLLAVSEYLRAYRKAREDMLRSLPAAVPSPLPPPAPPPPKAPSRSFVHVETTVRTSYRGRRIIGRKLYR